MANVKYPGRLGQRSKDLPPRAPTAGLLTGEPREEIKAEYERAKREWVTRQLHRELVGIARLLVHYNIEPSEDCFYRLALALARDHVPYLKKPAPRGRPATMQKVLPVIDAILRRTKKAGFQHPVFDWYAGSLGVDRDTVIREFKRYRAAGKGGKKKT